MKSAELERSPVNKSSTNGGLSSVSAPLLGFEDRDQNFKDISGCICVQSKAKPGEMPVKKRKWQEFPGRNKFCCDGRIMMSRQTGVFYFTVALILGTMAMFIGFDAYYLSVNLNPVIPVIAVVLLLLVMANLFRTSFSDPGVMPRASPAEAAEIERQITAGPWVGNCVGVRNYRYFYFFIVSLSFLCVYVFACVVVHIVLLAKQKTFLDAIQNSPGSIVVALICFFSVWSILGLAGFHTYLLTSNQTTNEDIKGTFSPKRSPNIVNPYSLGGVSSNCMSVICPPVPPSLIDRRGLILSEKEILVSDSVYRSHVNIPSPSAQELSAYGSVEHSDIAGIKIS